ncbi:type I polyketide synthase [Pseudoalteromonas luteoviolacea]|uniref:type I polyketide synthase n=1 Tax=Pseudoalteromonas luteoviolacea TaxID=43657 RepID=UPI001F1D3171|nr:type I polyketide synthase [Pseudoalteromonas luteoviolacea]MCF6439120.1 type I polyketide synthase [Pseudoalteromonas luteoviolacea]
MTTFESISDSDIAVIGLSCRFPGAKTADEFWYNLKHGVESITPFSDDALQKAGISASTMARPDYVKAGSVLEDIDKFDAGFFGLSPKEAESTDPQQRIFLECAWEALEDAGYVVDKDTYSIGVYAGAGMTSYFFDRVSDQLPFLEAQAFSTLLGNDKDYLATHAAYKLDLKGPAVSIQTACSTSLVATHMACQSLINGECDIALAGGISARVPHESGYFYHEAMMLSPDGHCRAFDAQSQGTVPGNGAGVVALKRLDDALADGDTIYAVIKGSAINNDGAGKVGFTAPSVEGQAAVISEAQAIADVDPETISYVEAHGTGTKLGDPIEIAALTRAFRFGTQKKGYCPIGTVKSNLGHLDAAAGIAGLIKTVLSLKHQQIPPSLHYSAPNPSIDFASSPFYVNTELTPWPRKEAPRRAGVSSFGMGGTNAHMVLEEAPTVNAPRVKQSTERQHHVLTLSGKSAQALAQQAGKLAQYLDSHPDLAFADVCYTAANKRAHFSHRLSLVASSLEDAKQQLRGKEYSSAQALEKAPKLAFLFTGQGAQYLAMGQQLFESQVLFRDTLERCDAILRPLDVPLLELLYGRETEILNQTQYTQPVLFAIEYALAKLWQSWGVHPDAVMGHSVGEYVAACLAGVFSLEDGLKLISARGRLMHSLCQSGEMRVLPVDEAKAQTLVAPFAERLSIAAVNGPENIVISGDTESMARLVTTLEAQGIQSKALSVSHAFHSAMMAPMLAEFASVAASIQFAKPSIPVCSNVTGEMINVDIASADYWVQHVCAPVRFAAGIDTLQSQGIEAFIEIGPKPVLLAMAKQCLANEHTHIFLPSLRAGQDDELQLLESLGQWHCHGGLVDWQAFDAGYGRRQVLLPTYAFQRQRYWMAPLSKDKQSTSDELVHPLLGAQLQLADTDKTRFASEISEDSTPWLVSHRVFGAAVLPAAGYIEMALCAGVQVQADKTSSIAVENIFFEQALILPEQGTSSIQTVMSAPHNDRAAQSHAFQIFSQDEHGQWGSHVTGQVVAEQTVCQSQNIDLEALLSSCPSELPVAEQYALWQSRGLHYGTNFQGLVQLHQGEGVAIGKVTLADNLLADGALLKASQRLHPAMLDACLQVMFVQMFDPTESADKTWLPVSIDKVSMFGAGSNTLWSVVKVIENAQSGQPSLTLDISIFDEAGKAVASIEGLTAVQMDGKTLRSHFAQGADDFYSLNWVPAPLPAASGEAQALGNWLIFADQAGEGEALAVQLQQQGNNCTLVYSKTAPELETVKGGYSSEFTGEKVYIDAEEAADFEALFAHTNQQHGALPVGVVHLWSLDTPTTSALSLSSLNQAQTHIGASVLNLVRAAAKLQSAKLWFVTRDAVNVGDDNHAVSVCQAPLWGTAKVIAQEHPDLWGGMIDSPSTSALLDELKHTVQSGQKEDHIAYRDGERYVARMEASISAPVQGHISLYADKSYLITGGMGKLGLHLARWMVEKGARHIALVGRNAPSQYAQEAINQLQGMGANVFVMQADVAKDNEVAQLFHQLSSDMPPLKGIIHAAGVVDRAALVEQSWQQFNQGMAAKVQGSWNLHCHTASLALDFFVLFSSTAAQLGGLNMASYAAGNAFIDALSQYRTSQGLQAQSINWSFWADGGMAGDTDAQASLGDFMLSTEQGLSILDALLSSPQLSHAFVFPGGLPAFLQQFYPGEIPAFLRSLSQENDVPSPQLAVQHLLDQADWQAHDEILEDFIRKELAAVLKLCPTQLDSTQALNSMGLDSLMTVGLRNRIRAELGVDISIAKFMGEGTTVVDLVAELNPPRNLNVKPQTELQEGEEEFKV